MNIVVNPGKGLYKAETMPGDGYAIELVAGSAVTDLLFNDHGFQKSWDLLFESCPWATVFQSRPFIAAWYQVYGNKHLPILIKAVERGQLTGVLPMALLNANTNDLPVTGKGDKITGAGYYDAEYQTWLAAPSDGNAFIKKALAELMKQFPQHPIVFRFLPPNTPLDWIKEDKKWRKRSIVQVHARPLLNLSNPEHVKPGGKHFRQKMNRLKKWGEVSFECIRDMESFKRSLNKMAVMYDFRQSALFNKNHFKEEPEKKDFLLELFRLNLLHTTVLKLDEKIVAAVIAIAGKDDWVHLAGMNCHSPFKARLYSPGFLHFTLLTQQLIKERTRYFDLTPGYDTYKEELANQHDEVRELMISSMRGYRIKKQIRKWVHARLIAMGIRPMTAELTLKKCLYQMRHWRLQSVIKKLTKSLYKKRKQKLYLIQTSMLTPDVKISLHKDSLHDLMECKPGKGSGLTRWGFVADAMYRLEKGQHCFTWMESGRLLCCAWFSYPDAIPTEKDTTDTNNTIALQSFYCHAAAKDRLAAFVNGMSIEVANNCERNSIYFLTNEPLFCEALEAAGFQAV